MPRLFLLQRMGQHIMFDLRNQIFAHLQRLPLQFYDRNPVGRLMTRLTSDVEALNELFSSVVVAFFGDMAMLLYIVFCMFLLDWRLALVSLAGPASVDRRHALVSSALALGFPRRAHSSSAHQHVPAGTSDRHVGASNCSIAKRASYERSKASIATIAKQTSTQFFTTRFSFRRLTSSWPQESR